MSDLNIAVIGSGVVGATTALELQKCYRNANITIVADKFDENTTSYVAAGLFRPSAGFLGPSLDVTQRWINDAYEHWNAIRVSREGARAGVVQLSGYMFSKEHPSLVRNPYIEKIVPIYRRATEEELTLCPGDWKYGSFFTTLLIQCSEYLPWANRRFIEAGGKVVTQKLDTLLNLEGNYDVVVNCCGLGARYLFNDNKLSPVRGQVLKVKAPWIKTFFYGEVDTYVIPGFDSVTLGGCRQLDSYNLKVDKYDSLAIRERCESLVPSLKNADLVAERVGLRPHRDPVRVEKETCNLSNGKRVKIVHNYGHGGYGVTTAPGTSIYAVQLVNETLAGNSKL